MAAPMRRQGALDQPEDADNPITAHQGHGTHFHGHPCAAGRYEDGVRIRSRGSAEHLASEQLACATGVLRRNHGREVTTANIADEPFGRRIEPADYPVASST